MVPFLTRSSVTLPQINPVQVLPSHTAMRVAAPERASDGIFQNALLSRIASSALSSVKLAACFGVAATLAGASPGVAVLAAVGALTVSTSACVAAAIGAERGYHLPNTIVQHGVCNDLHTLAGGLAGGTPATLALTAIALALADKTDQGAPHLGGNGLACLAVMVAVPATVLVRKSVNAFAGEHAGLAGTLASFAIPALTTGLALALPVAMLHQQASTDAALRFVVGFGANLASACVREGLTQMSLPAWSGIDRTQAGLDYGLREASGNDRLASTVVPTVASCLLFAGSSALTLHYLERLTDLGMAPATQALLSQSAAETGRRCALRALVLQSTNELLEGLWRGLSLAAYAGARGIEIAVRDPHARLADVPAALGASARDAATWNRATVFAAARTLDGALPNLLGQLASGSGAMPFWNGYRIGAVLAQGATMARTPILAAHILPKLASSPAPDVARHGASPEETADGSTRSQLTSDDAESSSTRISISTSGDETAGESAASLDAASAAVSPTGDPISSDSTEESRKVSSGQPTPCSDRRLAWA